MMGMGAKRQGGPLIFVLPHGLSGRYVQFRKSRLLLLLRETGCMHADTANGKAGGDRSVMGLIVWQACDLLEMRRGPCNLRQSPNVKKKAKTDKM